MADNKGSVVPLKSTIAQKQPDSDTEGKDDGGTDIVETPKRSDTYWYLQKKLIKQHFKKMLLVWIYRIIPIFASVAAVIYMIYLLSIPAYWSTNSNSTQYEKELREDNRETFVSILISFLIAVIGAYMFHIKVKEGLVIINYGFILGPVIRYILNQAIGHDAGLKDAFTSAGFAYAFSSLIGGNFIRYIITMFLDLFISHPLQDILKRQAKAIGVIEELKKDDEENKPALLGKYDYFIVLNFPSILQAIIAFVTYNAYTNQTREAWAYPPETLPRALRIPPGTIMLSTAVAAVLYLNFYTIMDYLSEREYFDVKTKLLYVLTILLTLYGLNFTESVEAPVYGEFDKEYTKNIKAAKPTLGFFVFIAFILYGFVYPIYTRLGCCGCCKRTPRDLEQTDHIMAESEGQVFSEEMLTKIRSKIREELEIAQQESMEMKQMPRNVKMATVSINAADRMLLEECLDEAIHALNQEESIIDEKEDDIEEATIEALNNDEVKENDDESEYDEMDDLIMHVMDTMAQESKERSKSDVENREVQVAM